MQTICDKDKCTGCGLCAASCPKNAIDLKIVGLHYHPVINQENCVDCGLCKKQCPNNSQLQLNENLKCFAAWSQNDYDHFESASGGIATTLGKAFLRSGGYVVGCVWDENLRATSIVTNNLNDLERIRKSKYVHNSFPKEVYKEILHLLKASQKVLFIGVPCQCDSIKKFAGKYSENLYVCDILCHGAASPKLFEDYLKSFKKEYPKIKNVTFRGGEFECWFCLWDENNKLLYKGEQFIDPYFYSFMRHTMYRRSCLSCNYAQNRRVGDLTLADFWGLDEKIVKKYNLKRTGVSLVLQNSEKGNELISLISGDSVFLERDIQEAINGNDTLKMATPKPFQYELLNKMYPLIGLKKSLLLFDVQYQLKLLKMAIRALIPDVVKKFIKKVRS